MTYERLDKGCKAEVLAHTDSYVLLRAWWPAGRHDRTKFPVTNGIARTITQVSREYFERKYGVKL